MPPESSADSDPPNDKDIEKNSISTRKASETAATLHGRTEDADPDVVDWDGPEDPGNPYNWSRGKIFSNFMFVASLAFMSPMASSIYAPAVPTILQEFGSNNSTLETFVVSVYLLGYAAGPLLTAPLSELYGRLPIYHASNLGCIIFTVAAALSPNLGALIVFRFFGGAFGVTPITNGGASVGDMIPPERRGKSMSVYLLGTTIAPVIGTIAGGFIAEYLGWRWCFWITAILYGALQIGMFFGMHETYAPTLLQRRTIKLRKETGNTNLRSALASEQDSPRAVFGNAIIRPLKLLFFSPIVNLVSFWGALAYAYVYILFTSISPVFQDTYGFRTDLVGLVYLGIGVGTLCGMFLYSSTADKYIQRKSAEADAKAREEGRAEEGLQAEYRLFLVPFGVSLLPIGLFIYGWSAQYRVQWIVPIIGTAFIGASVNILIMATINYFVDAFKLHAASAIAASTVMRCLLGGLLPLAALPMYSKLGLGWGNSLLAFIGIAVLPITFLVLKYGGSIRKKYEIKNL